MRSSRFSETAIRNSCPHCGTYSFALNHPLTESVHFWVVCDVHPLIEGHILIIPKQHYASIGEYPNDIFQEFIKLYEKTSLFIQKQYGHVATFEHGKIGQTVFHSHIHILPFGGSILDIIPEGHAYIFSIKDISALQAIFKKDDKYLFITIGKDMWVIDTILGKPRFFRDRFAEALGVPERGNWKTMHDDTSIMNKADKEIYALERKWKAMMNKRSL